MIKLLNYELLGTLRKGTTSFLIKYQIKNLTKKEVFKLNEALKTKNFCFDKNCYFYLDIKYDENISETIIGIILYLPVDIWPENKYDQEKVINEYIINIKRLLGHLLRKTEI